jgi:hypothetical protein
MARTNPNDGAKLRAMLDRRLAPTTSRSCAPCSTVA